VDFLFDNFNQFSVQHASPSCRTPTPINYLQNFYPHKPCSYCFNPYHEENNCPDLQAEFNDLRDKFYQIKAARFTPTHFSHTYTPHKPCSYCSNPYHNDNNCPSWGQFFNFSYAQMNISFSNLGCDSNFNFYNLDWSNQFNFSWQAHATRNYAHQFDEVHYSDYL
jgi:hypothetical protein